MPRTCVPLLFIAFVLYAFVHANADSAGDIVENGDDYDDVANENDFNQLMSLFDNAKWQEELSHDDGGRFWPDKRAMGQTFMRYLANGKSLRQTKN